MSESQLEDEVFKFRKIEFSDDAMMDKIYALRFEVYCRECGFIKAEDYPDQRERDEYDAQSIHFAAFNDDDEAVGTMRLIMPGEHPLPILEHCTELDVPREHLELPQAVEISRLVISKRLRRRHDDRMYYGPQTEDTIVMENNEQFLRRAKPMAFGLYREIYMESKRRGITEWYSLMERPLWFLLRIHGFLFDPIGEEVDVYGPVRPYVGRVNKIEQEVHTRFKKFYNYFVAKMAEEERPKFQEPAFETDTDNIPSSSKPAS